MSRSFVWEHAGVLVSVETYSSVLNLLRFMFRDVTTGGSGGVIPILTPVVFNTKTIIETFSSVFRAECWNCSDYRQCC